MVGLDIQVVVHKELEWEVGKAVGKVVEEVGIVIVEVHWTSSHTLGLGDSSTQDCKFENMGHFLG